MTRWARVVPALEARVRLVCIPRAGGSSADFCSWSGELGGDVEVHAIQLPGRLDRFREPPIDRLAPIAEQVASVVRELDDLPVVVLGDCMGALVAFEVARLLRRRAERLPAALIVASYAAPDVVRKERTYHDAPARELRERLLHIGGVPPEILQDDELFDVLLPSLRADFAVFETYEYEDPLAVDIHALVGRSDTHVAAGSVEGWRRHTAKRFELRRFDGDHSFLLLDMAVLDHIRNVALATVTGAQ